MKRASYFPGIVWVPFFLWLGSETGKWKVHILGCVIAVGLPMFLTWICPDVSGILESEIDLAEKRGTLLLLFRKKKKRLIFAGAIQILASILLISVWILSKRLVLRAPWFDGGMFLILTAGASLGIWEIRRSLRDLAEFSQPEIK